MINRRTFLAGISAPLLFPQAWQSSGTPVPTTSERPDEIDLGQGITMADYRYHPGRGQSGILGELRNDTADIFDTPVVSITYAKGNDSTGFMWLSPIIPAVRPGESVPMWGAIPDQEDTDLILSEPHMALCSAVEKGPVSLATAALSLNVESDEEYTRGEEYLHLISVTNAGTTTAENVAIRGIVRDAHGRLAGCTNTIIYRTFNTSTTVQRWITVNAEDPDQNRLNPFDLLDGTDYSCDIVVGMEGPKTSPGCEFGFPWDS